MGNRSDIVLSLASQEGSEAIAIQRTNLGWPTLVEVLGDAKRHRFAIHASVVSPHARAPHEYRFQNPASSSPVLAPHGYIPVLLGHFHDGSGPDIFVGLSGISRVGNSNRFSILFDKEILYRARRNQWAAYVSKKDEEIVAFLPTMSCVVFEALAASISGHTSLVELLEAIEETASNSFLQLDVPLSKNSVYVLRAIRNRAFAIKVMRADNSKCCVCGIEGPMLQAAHIYPHSADGSVDQLENGLTLCANHHLLFDRHHLAIHPKSLELRYSPDIQKMAQENNVLALFLQGSYTAPLLGKRDLSIVQRMAALRCQHFGNSIYRWLR